MEQVVRQARMSLLRSNHAAWRAGSGCRMRAFTTSHAFEARKEAKLRKPTIKPTAPFVVRYAPLSRARGFASTSARNSNKRTVDYLLADVGEGITECEIVKWFVEPGSHVEEFDILVEVQSDKASVEITSRYTGKVVEHCYNVGQVARVGSALCKIEMDSPDTADAEEIVSAPNAKVQDAEAKREVHDSAGKANAAASSAVAEQVNDTNRHRSLATPAVRRITRENNVDIANVPGTGRDGRVTKEDVQQYLSGKGPNGGEQRQSSPQIPPAPSSGTNVVPLSGIRKAMFKGMTSTWTAPHFGYSDEIDVTHLDVIRKSLSTNAQLKVDGQEVKLTLLPFLLKALSIALNDHAIFRSKLDAERMSLAQSDDHSLSIAFASPKGLLTPTLRGDVRSLSVIDIARQIAALQRNAATRGLTQEELGKGGTVTLSNIGSIGGTHTFPLLPPTGQLIIGAVGRTRTLPRFNEFDEVVKASILPVSFSADHRVVEGVELARFVSDWKALLENPTSWLLNLR